MSSHNSIVMVVAIVAIVALLPRCADPASSPQPDTASDNGTVEVTDTLGPDVVDLPDGATEDQGASDTATDGPKDTTDDGDTTASPETTPTAPTIAVPGARCTWTNRIGTVHVSAEGPQPTISAVIASGPSPWYGAPTLETETCQFYAYSDTCAGGCGSTKRCNHSGECVEPQTNLLDLRVAMSTKLVPDETTTKDTAWFHAEVTGYAWGQADLPGETFSAHVRAGEHNIVAEATELPGALDGIEGTLTGDYSTPEAVDVSWESHPGGAQVYTLVPINHHASGPTHTECVVSADVGSMHIDGDMLVPLSVSTGLEFQGLEHVRFAAAETPAGCVEFRFLRRIYVNLTQVP